jgi:hypothetical protein
MSRLHNLQDADNERLQADALLARLEEVRRAGQLDESAADMLSRRYV